MFIFLDHDGVLCLEQQWGSRYSLKKQNPFGMDNFDPKCVKVLNEILTELPLLDIIISSDWRSHLNLLEMRELYKQQGVIRQPIISFTGLYPSSRAEDLESNRVHEIKLWLNTHNITKNYVVVDDMDLGENWYGGLEPDHFVRCTKSKEGIKQTGLKEKIIKILTNG